jgi:hypothetical protein
MIKRFLVVILCLLPAIVLAADASPPDFVAEHVKAFEYVLSFVLAILSFFLIRLVKTVDKIGESLSKTQERVSFLEGQRKGE